MTAVVMAIVVLAAVVLVIVVVAASSSGYPQHNRGQPTCDGSTPSLLIAWGSSADTPLVLLT